MSSLNKLIAQLPLLSNILSPFPWSSSPGPNPSLSTTVQHCPNPSLSCPNTPPADIDTCCINHPSGHFLQTQFWDTSPSIGSNTSWTIHGLWPDLCTGGFDQFCDTTRSERQIRAILQTMDPGGNAALLDFMDANWLSIDGNPEGLWAHEWNKHGTCISTIEPACYARDRDVNDEDSGSAAGAGGSGTGQQSHPHQDLLDYFVQTTSLFRTLDTYAILAEAGVIPSTERRYDLTELQDAIEASPHGYPVTFRCRAGELNEIWYHFSVRGSLRNAVPPRNTSPTGSDTPSPFLNSSAVRDHFVPTIPDGAKSNCPIHGIKYLPKHGSGSGDDSPHHPPAHSSRSVTATATSTSTATTNPSATSTPFSGKGHLEVHVVSATHEDGDSSNALVTGKLGCLIRRGEWYTSGSCATYLAQSDVVDPGHRPLFSLSSSFSPCLVNPRTKRFECTKASYVQGIFSSDEDDSHVLAYKDDSRFYADKLPGRFEKVGVFADDDNGKRKVELEIRWVPV